MSLRGFSDALLYQDAPELNITSRRRIVKNGTVTVPATGVAQLSLAFNLPELLTLNNGLYFEEAKISISVGSNLNTITCEGGVFMIGDQTNEAFEPIGQITATVLNPLNSAGFGIPPNGVGTPLYFVQQPSLYTGQDFAQIEQVASTPAHFPWSVQLVEVLQLANSSASAVTVDYSTFIKYRLVNGIGAEG
jgi:hypothetical protein